jgi:hypothetical protein
MSHRPQPPVACRLPVLLLLLTALLVLGIGPARAQALGCGATVTQDVTLTADLLDCPGDGLVVGAAGITVDLNGHTVSGRIISGGDPGQVGIDNSGGHDDVTIRNGTVRDFARGGVHLSGPTATGSRTCRWTSSTSSGSCWRVAGPRTASPATAWSGRAAWASASSAQPRPAATT